MSQITPNSSPRNDRHENMSQPADRPRVEPNVTPSTLRSDDHETSEPRSLAEPSGSEASDDAIESLIRYGSPFQIDPLGQLSGRSDGAFHDVGPWRYTAMGAVAASMMVVAFGSAASVFFPIGGALIAALGCLLSVVGLSSSYRRTAAGLLMIHLMLFVLCYSRSLA